MLLDVLKEAECLEDYVISVRRHLHENPEIGLQEANTIKFVTKELESMNIPYEVIPNGGIIGYIKGLSSNKKIILRADLDALPMKENEYNLKQKKSSVSKTEHAAHTCGHDGHTAMLLGAAKMLSNNSYKFDGEVILAFEQAEEFGEGITNLISRLIEIGADTSWGIHLKSDIPAGKFSVSAGPRMAGAFGFNVVIDSHLGGHGSRPDLANSPLACFVELFQNLQMMRLNHLNPFDPYTISIGQVDYGFTGNIISENLKFSGTSRFFNLEQGRQGLKQFKYFLEKTCEKYNCSFSYIREPVVKDLTVNNNSTCSAIAEKAVAKLFGEESYGEYPAWMASEPFAYYQKFFPGVFAFIGIKNDELGSGADHHNEHFDIDESVLKMGVAATVQYVLDFCSSDTSALKNVPKLTSLEQL